MRHESCSRVPVGHEFSLETDAERQVGLDARRAKTLTEIAIATGHDEAEPRRKRDVSLAVSDSLVAIVQKYIAEADTLRTERTLAQGDKGIAKLMVDASDGPFLRESVGPVLRIGEIDGIADVLHEAKLLVVGFLDQETIVLDANASLGQM